MTKLSIKKNLINAYEAGKALKEKVDNGDTPLIIACYAFDDNLKLLKELWEQKGVKETLNTPNKRRWTPLIQATVKEHPHFVKFLLGKGADKTIADTTGKTALDYARIVDNQEIIDLLEGKF